MKINSFLILLFCLVTRLNAIEFYSSGDTLFVWARNGLIIRDSNSIRGNVLGTIGLNQKNCSFKK
ncbi:MAG: hypothetical protein ABI851_14275 [Saprospiraceae bacterium]